MSDKPATIEALARLLDCDFPSLVRRAEAGKQRVVMDGYGSIARPLADVLQNSGVRRFVLCDPKEYSQRSVASQCEADEVERRKAEVGMERLAAAGAQVAAYPRDLYEVPDGIVDPDTLVIASLDNPRATMGSSRRTVRMGGRMLKVNIEPAFETVAVRAYDYRHGCPLCVECQFGQHHYQNQRHPKSCDGPGDGRATNSPRWLSQAAANMGALAALEILTDDRLAKRWFGHEWNINFATQQVQRSQLMPKKNCRWSHTRRWRNVERLNAGVNEICLGELVKASAGRLDGKTHLNFCQRVALRGRCTHCHQDSDQPRWMFDLETDMHACDQCGHGVRASSFWAFDHLPARHLLPVMERPLSDWGVEPRAVINVTRGERETTFVV